ncbi:MAG: hypothetical protein M3299_05095 [Thermoproteota archaeon]|nr:hypothetical protein [Thermoproteota archaeon]
MLNTEKKQELDWWESIPTTITATIEREKGGGGVAATAAAAAVIMMLMTPMLLQVAFAAPTLQQPIQCEIAGDNQLRCEADVSGLGGAKTATATLTATATVTTGCSTTSGSNEPRSLQRTAITVTDTQTVNVGGGRTVFRLTTQPLNAEELRRTCPSENMTPTIVCVTYSNISTAVIPNSGPSKDFRFTGTVSNC